MYMQPVMEQPAYVLRMPVSYTTTELIPLFGKEEDFSIVVNNQINNYFTYNKIPKNTFKKHNGFRKPHNLKRVFNY